MFSDSRWFSATTPTINKGTELLNELLKFCLSLFDFALDLGFDFR